MQVPISIYKCRRNRPCPRPRTRRIANLAFQPFEHNPISPPATGPEKRPAGLACELIGLRRFRETLWSVADLVGGVCSHWS